jgi:putative ABC transport system permease protein
LPQEKNEILISDSFAQKLGVDVGEPATLISSSMYGSMAMQNVIVAGTVAFGMLAIDKSTVLMDIHDAQTVLDMNDGASEIVGFTKDFQFNMDVFSGLAKQFNSAYTREEDEFSPTMISLGDQGGLFDILRLSNTIGSLMVGIFVLAMSVVLWNAALMNGIRRYGEIGVRLAMGESKTGIYFTLIYESICIGVVGSALGTILGLAVSYWLQYKGIDISGMMQKSTVLISNVIRARVTPECYFIGFLPGLIASVLGTLFAGFGIYRRQTSHLFRELET